MWTKVNTVLKILVFCYAHHTMQVKLSNVVFALFHVNIVFAKVEFCFQSCSVCICPIDDLSKQCNAAAITEDVLTVGE